MIARHVSALPRPCGASVEIAKGYRVYCNVGKHDGREHVSTPGRLPGIACRWNGRKVWFVGVR